MEPIVRNLMSAVLMALTLCLLAVFFLLMELPRQIDARLASIERDSMAEIAAWRADTNAQVIGIRADVRGIAAQADVRTGEALAIVRTGVADADIQLTGVRGDLSSQLLAANRTIATTASPFADLARRYTLIPDQLAGDRETKGLIAETMGVLAATKITMGQIAKASKTFDDRWPSLLDSADASSKAMTGIFINAQRFTDKAVAPCRGWCVVRESFGVINGSIRAAGAAGVF